MIQGGGLDGQDATRRQSKHAPIKNESGNGLTNERGTIAMARTSDPDSATCQFFINVEDNAEPRHLRRRLRGLRQGHRRHGRGRQDRQGRHRRRAAATTNVPVKPIFIKSAKRKAK